jgi:hypothetical protein
VARWLLLINWRGAFTSAEVNALHAEAFETRIYDKLEWNWAELVYHNCLASVVARDGADLVGFVNVLWDGLVHAWQQNVMIASRAGTRASVPSWSVRPGTAPKAAGCDYLHLDLRTT